VPRPLTLLAAGLIGLGLLGCGSEGPERSSEPRVISLTPSISRIVQVLGADDLLIGVDEFSRRLPGLEGVPSVGGLFSPDLERIVDLDPTLILAVRTEQQRATLDRLRSRGVYVQEIEPYALEIAQKVRLELGVIRESVSGRRTVTTALVVQRDPLYVAGSGGFVSELIDIAGGENVFADLPSPYPRVSLEVLAARAPEVILDTAAEPERGEAGVREARAFWSRFAWAKRVEVIPRGVLTLPSPDLPKAAWMLRTRLHPDPTPGP
jgi:iron complex transport system substrate-binding protein